MPPGLSPAPRVAWRASGAPGPPGPARVSLDAAPLFQAGFHCRPLKCAAPFCCPASAANASFRVVSSQNLELGKQAHLFWNFIVREVSACVLVPRRPFLQALTFYVHSQQTNFVKNERALWVGTCKKVLLFLLVPPIHRLERIDS